MKTKRGVPITSFGYVFKAIQNFYCKKFRGLHKKDVKFITKNYDISDLYDSEKNTDTSSEFVRETKKFDGVDRFFKDDLVINEHSEERADEIHFMNLVVNYWEMNLDKKFGRSPIKKEIASRFIYLFKRSNHILHFRQESMMRYLRKSMGWDSDFKKLYGTYKKRAFKDVMSTFSKHHKSFRTQYRKFGSIDYFS